MQILGTNLADKGEKNCCQGVQEAHSDKDGECWYCICLKDKKQSLITKILKNSQCVENKVKNAKK